MNTIYKSKAEQRVETSEAIQQFLARGGSIEIVPAKKMRRRTTQKMASQDLSWLPRWHEWFREWLPQPLVLMYNSSTN